MEKKKSIFSYYKPYKKIFFADMFFAIMASIITLVIPLVVRYITSTVIYYETDEAFRVILKLGLMMTVLILFQCYCNYFIANYGHVMGAKIEYDMRAEIFAHYQKLPFSFYDNQKVGQLLSRITSDLFDITELLHHGPENVVISAMKFIGAFVILFTISPKLTFAAFALIPFMFLYAWFFNRKMKKAFARNRVKIADINAQIEDNLSGIRVVKSFNQEDHAIKKFKGISQSIYEDFAAGERLLAFNSPIMQFFMYACMILISWIGAKAVVASGNSAALGMTTGDLTALFSYATQILMALMMLSMVFAMITISLASAHRIAEVLEEKTDIANPTGAEMTVRDGSIRFEHVNFSYAAKADKKVLSDIDLSIASGQTVGIIGGTGSSKSSLVQLIPRLYDVSSGRLLLGGVDVRKYDLETLRSAVAMVLQKNELFSGTIKENLRWGNEAAGDEEMEEACRLACADEFIQGFPDKYDTYIEQGGSNVSGGQKQRLCIARTLLKKPKVLILDDSTSAVDTKTDAAIQKSLSTFLPDTTKLIIAQRVSSVQHADLIIVMDEGKIVATGRHEDLLKTCEIYRQVYESQQKGDSDHE